MLILPFCRLDSWTAKINPFHRLDPVSLRASPLHAETMLSNLHCYWHQGTLRTADWNQLGRLYMILLVDLNTVLQARTSVLLSHFCSSSVSWIKCVLVCALRGFSLVAKWLIAVASYLADSGKGEGASNFYHPMSPLLAWKALAQTVGQASRSSWNWVGLDQSKQII